MSSLLDVALATADGLRLDGAFVAADQAYRNILASHPESGMAWRGFALLAHAAGEQELARQIMQDRAVPLLPQDQRPLAAIDLLAMTLDKDAPPDGDVNETLSLAYDVLNARLAAGQFAQAADILRPLRQIYPTDAAVTESLAACLHNLAVYNQHDLPTAIAYAEEACALAPDSSDISYFLAKLYHVADMPEKRCALIDRTIERFDRNVPPPPPPPRWFAARFAGFAGY